MRLNLQNALDSKYINKRGLNQEITTHSRQRSDDFHNSQGSVVPKDSHHFAAILFINAEME